MTVFLLIFADRSMKKTISIQNGYLGKNLGSLSERGYQNRNFYEKILK